MQDNRKLASLKQCDHLVLRSQNISKNSPKLLQGLLDAYSFWLLFIQVSTVDSDKEAANQKQVFCISYSFDKYTIKYLFIKLISGISQNNLVFYNSFSSKIILSYFRFSHHNQYINHIFQLWIQIYIFDYQQSNIAQLIAWTQLRFRHEDCTSCCHRALCLNGVSLREWQLIGVQDE